MRIDCVILRKYLYVHIKYRFWVGGKAKNVEVMKEKTEEEPSKGNTSDIRSHLTPLCKSRSSVRIRHDNNLILFKRFSLPDDWFLLHKDPQGLNTNYILLLSSYIYGRHYGVIIIIIRALLSDICEIRFYALAPFPHTYIHIYPLKRREANLNKINHTAWPFFTRKHDFAEHPRVTL